MRNLIISCYAICLVISQGCSKSNDATPSATVPSLVGTWQTTTVQLTGCDESTDNSPEVSCAGGGIMWGCYLIHFYADGSTSWTSSSSVDGTQTGTYQVNGNNLAITWDHNGATHVFPFIVSATTLTLTEVDGHTASNGLCDKKINHAHP